MRKLFKLKIFGKNKRLGQTAIELAVFGSIFVFVMGAIVKTAMGTGYKQQHALKAMRLAMRLSYLYSRGSLGTAGDNNSSRNSANVFLIEDRLTASNARYGTVDRIPYMMSGQATHTRNLFLSLDYGEDHSLSVSDYWINGIHFPFSAARFISMDVSQSSTLPLNWDPACARRNADNVLIGCAMVYEKIPNHKSFRDDGTWDSSCDICFDLDRDGTVDLPDGTPQQQAFRDNFAWQWKVRYAYRATGAPGYTFLHPGLAIDDGFEPGATIAVDVDGDFKEETIYSFPGVATSGVYTTLRGIDFQAGDIDTTWTESDPGDQPGLKRDVEVFTFLRGASSGKGGTYALVEEGMLYDVSQPGRQFIRTARKKDQIDIIQREIQLSNNTGRFCGTAPPHNRPGFVEGRTNPVEVCVATANECFGGNMPVTCLAVEDKLLFVRSRIADLRGRKWVTDTTDDDYVEFNR